MGKVSGAIGDFAAKLTGDDEFQEQRRRSADTWGQSLEGAAKVGYAAVKNYYHGLYKDKAFSIPVRYSFPSNFTIDGQNNHD